MRNGEHRRAGRKKGRDSRQRALWAFVCTMHGECDGLKWDRLSSPSPDLPNVSSLNSRFCLGAKAQTRGQWPYRLRSTRAMTNFSSNFGDFRGLSGLQTATEVQIDLRFETSNLYYHGIHLPGPLRPRRPPNSVGGHFKPWIWTQWPQIPMFTCLSAL